MAAQKSDGAASQIYNREQLGQLGRNGDARWGGCDGRAAQYLILGSRSV
jgi:hypothetical protein